MKFQSILGQAAAQYRQRRRKACVIAMTFRWHWRSHHRSRQDV